MKTVILIGNGKVGRAALAGLGSHKVITASRSGRGCDYEVDITDEASIRKLFQQVGEFDAVVNTAGECEYAPVTELTEQQWMTSIASKMMGQINLVRIGQDYIADGGSFTLISGILNIKPVPQAITDAVTSGAIDTYVKCAGYEMPRGIRINAINPTILEESWDAYGELMPGFQPVPGRLVGKAFERAVDGFLNGEVIYVDA